MSMLKKKKIGHAIKLDGQFLTNLNGKKQILNRYHRLMNSLYILVIWFPCVIVRVYVNFKVDDVLD